MPSLRRRSESRHPSAAGAEPQVLDGHPWGNAAAQSELGLARQGLGGGGTSFPFADRIAACMGDHDLYGVQAFLGGLAAASCEDLGAEAYHDYHKATKQHGDAPITMRVREAD